MIALLKSITRRAAGSYQVVLEDANGARVFTLTVEADDIQCVTWQDDFAEYMSQNLAPASTLFEAVMAFHRAEGLSVPKV
jgi:hypothetical protein